jgi:hypothetical protein
MDPYHHNYHTTIIQPQQPQHMATSRDYKRKLKELMETDPMETAGRYIALPDLPTGQKLHIWGMGMHTFPQYGLFRQLDEKNYSKHPKYPDNEPISVVIIITKKHDGTEQSYKVPMFLWAPLSNLIKSIQLYKIITKKNPFPTDVTIDSLIGSPEWISKLNQLIPANFTDCFH